MARGSIQSRSGRDRAVAVGGSAERTRLYDATAGPYSAVTPLIWTLGFPRLRRRVLAHLAGRERVLDAGTGEGYWARRLAAAEPRRRVVGVDLSPEFVRRARARSHPSIELTVADLAAVPFGDGEFDGILCSRVLDTLPEAGPAMHELGRVLAPGGTLVLLLRGREGPLSTGLELLFRYAFGAAKAIRARSLAELRVSDRAWNREPLAPRLPALAREAGLRLDELDAGPLLSRAVLSRAARR